LLPNSSLYIAKFRVVPISFLWLFGKHSGDCKMFTVLLLLSTLHVTTIYGRLHHTMGPIALTLLFRDLSPSLMTCKGPAQCHAYHKTPRQAAGRLAAPHLWEESWISLMSMMMEKGGNIASKHNEEYEST
jgi:hypothetical protein